MIQAYCHFLLEISEDYHFLLGISEDYHFLLEILEDCHFLSVNVEDYHFLLETVEDYHFLLDSVEVCHFLLETVEGCHFLSETVEGCHFRSEKQVHFLWEKQVHFLGTSLGFQYLWENHDHFPPENTWENRQGNQEGCRSLLQIQEDFYLLSENQACFHFLWETQVDFLLETSAPCFQWVNLEGHHCRKVTRGHCHSIHEHWETQGGYHSHWENLGDYHWLQGRQEDLEEARQGHSSGTWVECQETLVPHRRENLEGCRRTILLYWPGMLDLRLLMASPRHPRYPALPPPVPPPHHHSHTQHPHHRL